MIEKALILIMFMYSVSFGVLGMQYVAGDVFGITIRNIEGAEIQSNLLEIIDIDTLNQGALNITGTNRTDIVDNPITGAAAVAWEIFLLLTGTYIFNVLYLFGVPSIIIAGMVVLYVFLLARALIAYIRGI